MTYYIYAISVFLSAFLLFQIQPMIGKLLLPWYGGTPTVWSTIILFSQVLLLGGYTYAYWLLGHKRTRTQGLLHLVLLGTSLALMIYLTVQWPSPFTPDANWQPYESKLLIWEILWVLSIAIGIPFLLLSSTSTLMQAWLNRDLPKLTPYRFYAYSNAGSLLALITYPIIIEPKLDLKTQIYLWSLAYVGFMLPVGYLALRTFRWKQSSEILGRKKSGISLANRPNKGIQYLWIALAACASMLLIASTNLITNDAGVVPFLWVLPLVIYLLTFILAFAGGKLYSRWIYFGCFIVVSLSSRMLLKIYPWDIAGQIFIVLLLLFISCMLCHNELYNLRPKNLYLPSFYLMMALGGVVGSISVTLMAPLIFKNGYWELQWALISLVVLMAVVIQRENKMYRRVAKKTKLIILIMAAIAVLQTFYVIYSMHKTSTETELSLRNFFGLLRVQEYNTGQPELKRNVLIHGREVHGYQFENKTQRRVPTAYYGTNSGVGLAILNHTQRPGPLRIGALGLGIGVVSSYGKPNDLYRFYEVNPDMIRIAEGEGGYFTYLDDSFAEIEIIEGDARVSLEQELLAGDYQNYDVLILDTFIGDTIPTHLLTKEAFEVYLGHLKDDGVIAIDITNDLYNLQLPIYLMADELNLQAAMIESPGEGFVSYEASWMLLTHNSEFLAQTPIFSQTTVRPTIPDNLTMWTDNFSNLFQIMK